jgi:hypothetical protein
MIAVVALVEIGPKPKIRYSMKDRRQQHFRRAGIGLYYVVSSEDIG